MIKTQNLNTSIPKYLSYAKVNIFLKISGKRDNYHTIVSRFMKVKNLYDTIELIDDNPKEFNLIGSFGCNLEKNTMYKAYKLLSNISPKVNELFSKYSVKVTKNIPEFAGLGGGSSNAATLLNIINEKCELNLNKDELSKIGLKIGADVPFFVYDYDSANVTGIGEIVERFDEKALNIKTLTPKDIKCNTGEIFTLFRDKFYKEISNNDSKKLLKLSSYEYLNTHFIDEANDLFLPVKELYPDILKYIKNNTTYFSGSGSSLFWIEEEK